MYCRDPFIFVLDVRAERRKEFARIVILCRSFEEGERTEVKPAVRFKGPFG